jgi:hypothetical protein
VSGRRLRGEEIMVVGCQTGMPDISRGNRMLLVAVPFASEAFRTDISWKLAGRHTVGWHTTGGIPRYRYTDAASSANATPFPAAPLEIRQGGLQVYLQLVHEGDGNVWLPAAGPSWRAPLLLQE